MQAEIISWYDWQWMRVSKELSVPRDKFISMCMDRAALLSDAQSMYIAACCLPGKDLYESSGLGGIKEVNEAVKSLYREFLFDDEYRKNLLSKVDQMTADGMSALRLCVLPHMCGITAGFHPMPVFYRQAHYRKASNRVYLFLKSLGAPDKELRKEFLTDVCNIQVIEEDGSGKKMVQCSPYEQHLMLDTTEDGKTSTVFLDFYAGAGTSFLHVRNKGMQHQAGIYVVSTRRELVGAEYTQSDENISNPDGEKYAEYFDLLVNAWVAEKTGMLVEGEENKAEKARVRNIIGSVYKQKDSSVRYEYIKVTDKAWQMHTESQKAFKERSEDCTYTKHFWWRRPHFAVRGENKVMVKGHWCHRRCGEVVEVDEPQVIEVLT